MSSTKEEHEMAEAAIFKLRSTKNQPMIRSDYASKNCKQAAFKPTKLKPGVFSDVSKSMTMPDSRVGSAVSSESANVSRTVGIIGKARKL